MKALGDALDSGNPNARDDGDAVLNYAVHRRQTAGRWLCSADSAQEEGRLAFGDRASNNPGTGEGVARPRPSRSQAPAILGAPKNSLRRMVLPEGNAFHLFSA